MQDFTNCLRSRYRRDREFRALIDNLAAEELRDAIGWLIRSMRRHQDRAWKTLPARTLGTLIDNDLVLTIKDRVTAPYYGHIAEADLMACLRRNGFTRMTRLTRYPAFGNVRRFLAPLYDDYRHPVSQLLYGEGCIQIRAVKSRRPRKADR
jgi:hypothetical protein